MVSVFSIFDNCLADICVPGTAEFFPTVNYAVGHKFGILGEMQWREENMVTVEVILRDEDGEVISRQIRELALAAL